MKEPEKVGISDMSFYIPPMEMDLKELQEIRSKEDETLGRHFSRALDSTGQQKIRFPRLWEDTATMAAEAASIIFDRKPDEIHQLRYITAGTESSLDFSKPLSSYIHGLLQMKGYPVGSNLTNFQVQHACAGGTLSLLSVASLLHAARTPQQGMVLCSDIARYDIRTTAEITQGAGSVALLVEKDPQLLELDLGTIGYSSSDVDDFFRPLDSVTAKVKGGYSVKCYNDAVESAFQDLCGQLGQSPREMLDETDYFMLHSPYYSLPIKVMTRILKRLGGYEPPEIEKRLEESGFRQALESQRQVGNIYTGSLYFSLGQLLYQQYKKQGTAIEGKNLLLGSYGSGNTMIFLRARIAEGASRVLESWDPAQMAGHPEKSDYAEYSQWISSESGKKSAPQKPGCFYLSDIREDGYRIYGISGKDQ